MRNIESRNPVKEKSMGGGTEILRNAVCDERGDHARNQGCIVHDTDTDDLHRKDRGSHRCAKECGKGGTHAAHDHDMLIFFIKAEQSSERVPDTAAELQSCAFASGRTAANVCDQCGKKNKRCHPKRDLFARMDRG